jgi:hypothetical protein
MLEHRDRPRRGRNRPRPYQLFDLLSPLKSGDEGVQTWRVMVGEVTRGYARRVTDPPPLAMTGREVQVGIVGRPCLISG